MENTETCPQMCLLTMTILIQVLQMLIEIQSQKLDQDLMKTKSIQISIEAAQ